MGLEREKRRDKWGLIYKSRDGYREVGMDRVKCG